MLVHKVVQLVSCQYIIESRQGLLFDVVLRVKSVSVYLNAKEFQAVLPSTFGLAMLIDASKQLAFPSTLSPSSVKLTLLKPKYGSLVVVS